MPTFSRSTLIEILLRTNFSDQNGWSIGRRRQYFDIDLTCENSERVVWLVNVCEFLANDVVFRAGIRDAIARLLLNMGQGFPVNMFGLAEPDEAADPALVRYAVAIEDTADGVAYLSRVPQRIRLITQLSFILISSESETRLYLPGVSITE
jgi:hypothetical protein